jgi:hypothetical protein
MTQDQRRRIESVVVLQLLRDDRGPNWTVAQLEAEMPHVEMLALREAVGCMEDAGIAVVAGRRVSASVAVRHLDALGLIGV